MLLILPFLPAIGSAVASTAGPAALAASSLSQGAQNIMPHLLNALKNTSVNFAGRGFGVGINNRRRGSELTDLLEQLRAGQGGGAAPPDAQTSLPVTNVGRGGPITFDSLLRPGQTFVDNRRFNFDRPVSLGLR